MEAIFVQSLRVIQALLLKTSLLKRRITQKLNIHPMESAKSPNEEALEATVTYLEGLPTGTSTDSAIANIDGWEQKLRQEGKPEWTTIADELKNLKNILTSGQLSGKAISTSLTKLGELTQQSAKTADKSIADDLQKLGGWLIKMAKAING